MSKRSSSKGNTIIVGRELGNLEWQARFVVGLIRDCSEARKRVLLSCLGAIGTSMERYGCSNIKQIGQAEIERFFAELRAKGLSAGHITIYATAMRMLCRMLDKLQLVPDNRTLGCQRIKLKVRS